MCKSFFFCHRNWEKRWQGYVIIRKLQQINTMHYFYNTWTNGIWLFINWCILQLSNLINHNIYKVPNLVMELNRHHNTKPKYPNWLITSMYFQWQNQRDLHSQRLLYIQLFLVQNSTTNLESSRGYVGSGLVSILKREKLPAMHDGMPNLASLCISNMIDSNIISI